MSILRRIGQADPTASGRAICWGFLWFVGAMAIFSVISDDVRGRCCAEGSWDEGDVGILVLGCLLWGIVPLLGWLLGFLKRTNRTAYVGLWTIIGIWSVWANHRTQESLRWQAYTREMNAPPYRNPNDVEPPMSPSRPPWG